MKSEKAKGKSRGETFLNAPALSRIAFLATDGLLFESSGQGRGTGSLKEDIQLLPQLESNPRQNSSHKNHGTQCP